MCTASESLSALTVANLVKEHTVIMSHLFQGLWLQDLLPRNMLYCHEAQSGRWFHPWFCVVQHGGRLVVQGAGIRQVQNVPKEMVDSGAGIHHISRSM